MEFKRIFHIILSAFIFIGFLYGCSTHSSRISHSPAVESESAHKPSAEFETPPLLNVRDLLPPALRKSPYHQVDETVSACGFNNAYIIRSEFGKFNVRSDRMLKIRVREIRAVAAIREIKATFKADMGKAGKNFSPYSENLLLFPSDNLTGLPGGLWHRIAKTNDTVQTKIAGIRRTLAWHLGTNVYSTTKRLQEELNILSCAVYTGKIDMDNVISLIPDRLRQSENKSLDKLNKVIRDLSPEQLLKRNRGKLKQMGIKKHLTEAFLHHRWLSPRYMTAIISALASMNGTKGREHIISMALASQSEDDALFVCCLAEMMQNHHMRIAQVKNIVSVHEFPICRDARNRLVLLLPADYGVWSRDGANFIKSIMSSAAAKRTELRITGELSAKAREKIEALGIRVYERSFR